MKRLAFLLLAACGGPVTTAKPAAQLAPSFCPADASSLTVNATSDAFVGKQVDHVCVVGGSAEARAVATGAVSTQPGATLTTKRIHDDLVALLDLPMVEDATAYARRVGTAITVVYAITERPTITEVRFEGVHAFTDADLAKVPLVAGQRFDDAAAHAFARTLLTAYRERAYGAARITVTHEPASQGAVRVVYRAEEGAVWRFGAVNFRGNVVLTTPDLITAADLPTGDAWNEDRASHATLAVQALAYDRGLLTSHVSESHAVGADGRVSVTIDVHEGDVFHLAKIRFDGIADDAAKPLLAGFQSKPKAVFSRKTLMADLEAAKQKLKKDIQPETNLDPGKKTVDLVLRVR